MPKSDSKEATSDVHLRWSSTGDITKSPYTQPANGQVRVDHSAQQVVDQHLNQ